jgi:hypothetical protein
MAHGSASDVTAKWLQRIGAAQAEMSAGVDRVTQAPGDLAAAKKQKWVNALMTTAVQDKWARNVRAGGALEPWRASMKNYGISRAIEGAQAKQAKFEQAMNSLLPFVDNLRTTVRAMDDSTPAAREQRMLAWVRGMRNYQRPSS